MIRFAALAFIAAVPTCQSDETVAGYGASGQIWSLTELDGAQFEANASLSFPEVGLVSGQGPCNRFSASMTAPYPWFEIGPIQSAKMACPDLEAESAFILALSAMSQSEVLGDTLILRNDAGLEMVFKSSE